MRREEARSAVLAVLVVALVALNLYQAWPRSGPAAPGGGAAAAAVAGPGPAEAQAIADLYHRVYYEGGAWRHNRWLGIPTLQNPNDVWVTQEILSEVKPDFLVETGTLLGGSALLWAGILREVNPAARVITIDIEDMAKAARQRPLARERIDFLVGSSTAPEIVAEVKRRVQGRKTMVLLDSDHRKPHVLAELRAYADLVSPGSYLIVQDTNVNGHPVLPAFGPGPGEAVQEFLAADQRFEADRSRERMLFTMHPGGYLRRVK